MSYSRIERLREVPQSPEGLAACEGRYPLAIGYLSLFWPLFVEYEGMVLRADEVDEASASKWVTATERDRQAVEATINHFHVLTFNTPESGKMRRRLK